jgi:hypothetical protein
LIAAAVVALSAGPARAFYWYGPPPPTLINPPDLNTPGSPPPPPSWPGPPGVTPPVIVPPVPNWPGQPCPEPATILGVLSGLGTIAAARAWRRRR